MSEIRIHFTFQGYSTRPHYARIDGDTHIVWGGDGAPISYPDEIVESVEVLADE